MPFLAVAIAPAGAAEVIFALEGPQMVARGADGAKLAPGDLAGATVHLGDAGTGIYTVRIDAVIADPAPGPTSLYDLSLQTPGSESWRKLCEPDPQGRTTAIPVPGSWAEDRFVHATPGRHATHGDRHAGPAVRSRRHCPTDRPRLRQLRGGLGTGRRGLHRARVAAFPLEAVLLGCPRLAAAGPCTEDAIWTLPGALLGNRS